MENAGKPYATKLFDLLNFKIDKAREAPKFFSRSKYMPAKKAIDAAFKKGISVSDYLETVRSQKSNMLSIMNQLQSLDVFSEKIENVLEIGAGEGVHAEKVIELCKVAHYESYETDRGWANWLARQYNIIAHKADGNSLNYSADLSIDLVLARGIFIYNPFLIVHQYFQEIVRVTKKGGYVVFDIFSEECFDLKTLQAWSDSDDELPYFLRKNYVIDFFDRAGFRLIGEFFNEKFDVGKSKYLVFQRTEIDPSQILTGGSCERG